MHANGRSRTLRDHRSERFKYVALDAICALFKAGVVNLFTDVITRRDDLGKSVELSRPRRQWLSEIFDTVPDLLHDEAGAPIIRFGDRF